MNLIVLIQKNLCKISKLQFKNKRTDMYTVYGLTLILLNTEFQTPFSEAGANKQTIHNMNQCSL